MICEPPSKVGGFHIIVMESSAVSKDSGALGLSGFSVKILKKNRSYGLHLKLN